MDTMAIMDMTHHLHAVMVCTSTIMITVVTVMIIVVDTVT